MIFHLTAIADLYKPAIGQAHAEVERAKPHAASVLLKCKNILTLPRILVALSTLATVSLATYLALFLWPRSITFSYSQPSCITSPTLLPNLVVTQPSRTYRLVTAPNVRFGNHPIHADKVCVAPQKAPLADSTEKVKLTAFGGLLTKNLTVATPKPPTAKLAAQPDKPVPAKSAIAFVLSGNDTTFNYQLTANNRSTACTNKHNRISCELAELNLAQSKSYTFSLQRLFKDSPAQTVLTESLTTVEPIYVTRASVNPGQLIYDSPASLTLQLNKPASEITNATLSLITSDNKEQPQTIESTITGTAVTITYKQPLPRSSNFRVSIAGITASDGGYLVAPYTLAFATSGGPKVTGISIGSTRVSPGASITLTFDTAPSSAQDIQQYINLLGSNGTIPASVARRGTSVTITPASSLGLCTSLTVRVTDGLQNEFGISGNTSWQFKSRTTCQTVFSIGTSVQGRGITAYSFGTGSTKIVFVGGTHGNEQSSTHILNDWINYLESNPGVIPANRTIIIIPKLNPDGLATGSRTNANNIDLNRNFPANNWKSGITLPSHAFLEHGGGITPLSEPESKALASYVSSQQPRMVLTYHAAAGVATPNGSGDSNALTRLYADKSVVGFLDASQVSSFFDYDTTGAFEDWLSDKLGIAAILVELDTSSGYEFSGHRAAMLDIITR